MIGDKYPRGFTLFETVIVLTVFSIAILIVVTIFSNASQSQRREAVSQKALADARVLLNTLAKDIQTKRIDYNFYKGNDEYDDGLNTYDVDCTTFEDDQCDLRFPVHVLALVSESGEKIRYWFKEADKELMICTNNPGVSARVCGLADLDGDTTTDEQFISVTPASVDITRMNFYITPATDPGYTGESVPCSFDAACACINGPGGSDEQDANDSGGCPMWTSGYCDPLSTCQLPDAQPTVTVSMTIAGQGLQVGEVQIPLQFTSTSRIYDR